MKRRNLELALLILGAPLVILLFAMLALNSTNDVKLTSLTVPLALFAAFIISHIVIRFKAPNADPAILPIVFVLAGIGICFVTRLAPKLAFNQVIWLFLGVAFMIAILCGIKKFENLSHYKYTFIVLGLVLLLSPLIPGIGKEIYGSRIWLGLGPFSFQPGELAKIAIVLFAAGYLSTNREMLSIFSWHIGPLRLPDPRALLPVVLMWGVALCIAVFEKDLGSAMVFYFVFLAMLYTATGKKIYLVLGTLLLALGFVAAWSVFTHVQIRVANWINPFADAQGAGYQMVQAIYSIADGDIFGQGIGRGLAYKIPVVESDFIFASIAEEMGLLRASGVLMLYLCFAIRGYASAARAKTDFTSFVCVGLTTLIVLQTFIIVGGVTGLIPLTGLTLPFISQGGSSLLASFMAVGFLLKAGDEGTGVTHEMRNATTTISSNSVLGRVALGKRLTHSVVWFSFLFCLLVGNLVRIMVVSAEAYQTMPSNNHTILRESHVQRGTITTADNVVLAQSVLQEDGTYQRKYPEGDLASHVVGYYSNKYGTSGIEASQNTVLSGAKGKASWIDVLKMQAGGTRVGNSVELSLVSSIQHAAQNALLGFNGACVVLDPKTGAVLAMASSPSYKASQFEQVLKDSLNTHTENSKLLNRATQVRYAPGSTFKIVTLATALEQQTAQLSTRYNSPGTIEIGGGKVSSEGKHDLGSITLQKAFAYSSNTVFGQVAVQLGAQKLVDGAHRFGFDTQPAFDVPTAKSLMANPADMTLWETAWAGAGQPVGNHDVIGPQATVLQMGMVACAVANEGKLIKPYLVKSIYNADGEKSYSATPKMFMQAMSPQTAHDCLTAMLSVVEEGTGRAARIANIKVAGKTGTAQTSKQDENTWFVGFAPADNPRVAIALILERSNGTVTAAAKAQNVLKSALVSKGLD